MEVNRINNRTRFTGFFINQGNGFRDLARKGIAVSTNVWVDNVLINTPKGPEFFKTLDIFVNNSKIETFLTDTEAKDFSALKHIADKLEFFNKYLKEIDIHKYKIEMGKTTAFDTYILS